MVMVEIFCYIYKINGQQKIIWIYWKNMQTILYVTSFLISGLL